MSIMFAIISCERDRLLGAHDAIRSTYMGKQPHMFYMDAAAHPDKSDEITLPNTNGGYHFTWQRNNAIIRIMLACGYDYLFTCDVDTYVVVPRLLAFPFGGHDYIGRRCDEGHAGGGCGYLLSRRAAEILSADPPDGTAPYNDVGIGRKLWDHGVEVWPRNDLFAGGCPASWAGNAVTAHLGRGTGTWNPQWMYDCHQVFLETTKCTS